MRFSIFSTLLLTAFVALAIELGVFGEFMGLGVGTLVVGMAIFVPVMLFAWLSNFFASRLAARLSEGPALRGISFIFGRMRLCLILSSHAASLTARGEHDAALSFYKKAASLTPKDLNACTNLGVGHYYVGDWAAAIESLSSVLVVDSSHAGALSYRGLALFASGNFAKALKDLLRVESADASCHYVALARGQVHEVLMDWASAIDDYRLASRLEENDLTAPLYLARLLSGCQVDELRNGQQAVEIAHRACIRTGWKDWSSISILAAAYSELGNLKRALEFAELSVELAPPEAKAERIKRVEEYRAGQSFRVLACASG